MQNDGTEEWPFSEDNEEGSGPETFRTRPLKGQDMPPPLEVRTPTQPPPLQVKPKQINLPPPLTKVSKPEKLPDANTAPPVASLEQSATLVPTLPNVGSEVPQNASEGHSQPSSPAIPELVVVKRGEPPPPPPALEITRPSDWVYVLLGQNVDADRMELCRILPPKSIEARLKKNDIDESLQYFRALAEEDLAKAAEDKNNVFRERLSHITTYSSEGNAVDQREGIIFRMYARDDGIDSTNADAPASERATYPFVVYRWCVVKYRITSPHRFDLTRTFFSDQ